MALKYWIKVATKWLAVQNPVGNIYKLRNKLTQIAESAPNAQLTNPYALVVDPGTGGFITYQDYANRYLKPDEVVQPPQPAIVWEDSSAIQAEINAANSRGDASITFVGRNIASTPTQDANMSTLFTLPNNGTKVIFDSCRFKSTGHCFGTWRIKLGLYNCRITMKPPTISGRNFGYIVNAEEWLWLDIVRCTFDHMGKGIYMSGNSTTKVFQGNPANGDRGVIKQNICYVLDGRRGDGAGGFIQSHWSSTNGNRPAGHVVGVDPANFVRNNNCPMGPVTIEYNLVIPQSGEGRPEDVIAFQGGSGGTAAYPSSISKNFVINPGGMYMTWNKISSPYYANSTDDPSPQTGTAITATYSGTCILVGDGSRTENYNYNTSYVTVDSNYCLGYRAYLSQQAGHHVTISNNKVFYTPNLFHKNNVVYNGGPQPGFQTTDYHDGQTAPLNGVATVIWGFNTYTNNKVYDLASGGPTVLGPQASSTKNGSVWSGNTRENRSADTSGAGAILAEYYAMCEANGITVFGSSLSAA